MCSSWPKVLDEFNIENWPKNWLDPPLGLKVTPEFRWQKHALLLRSTNFNYEGVPLISHCTSIQEFFHLLRRIKYHAGYFIYCINSNLHYVLHHNRELLVNVALCEIAQLPLNTHSNSSKACCDHRKSNPIIRVFDRQGQPLELFWEIAVLFFQLYGFCKFLLEYIKDNRTANIYIR